MTAATAKKIKYSVVLPDGNIATRTSARTYTHAVVARDEDGWGVYGFNGSKVLAQRVFFRLESSKVFDEVKIVEVQAA